MKKVIDIFPPSHKNYNEDGDYKKDEIPAAEAMPSIAPYIEVTPKPKITFSAASSKNDIPPQNNPKFSGVFKFFAKLAVIIIIVLTAMIVIDAKYAQAVIVLIPQTSPVNASNTISVNPKITTANLEKLIIPGITITIDKDFSGDFKATGKVNNQSKAKGVVKITNNYTNAQTLIAGTRLQPPADKFSPPLSKDQSPWFRTLKTVTIQPKESVMVEVIADEPGPQYNIEPSAFSIPGLVGTPQYAYILSQSLEKFSGGADSTVLQVTQQDLDNAKNSLSSIIRDQAINALRQKLSGDDVLIPETVNTVIDDITFNAAAGAMQDVFSATAKVQASALAVRQSDLNDIGKKIIQTNIQSGFALDDKNFKVNQSYVKTDQINGLIILNINVEGQEYYQFDNQAIKQALAQKSITEAKAILANDANIKTYTISLKPFWRRNLPSDPDKINIKQEF